MTSRSLIHRRCLTFKQWGQGAAGPTPENMNRWRYGQSSYWAREDADLRDKKSTICFDLTLHERICPTFTIFFTLESVTLSPDFRETKK